MTGPIVVTGAAGFAGGHLLERLHGRAELVAWRHREGPPPPWAPPGVRWMAVDLLDREAVHRAVRDVRPSQIYHCAGAPHVGDAWHDTRHPLATNVMGTHHVVDAVRRTGFMTRVLVVSSATVYQSADRALSEDDPLRPANPYGLSKLAQERVVVHGVSDDGLDLRLARPFNHAGPRQDPSFVTSSIARQIARIEAGQAPPRIEVGNVSPRRDVTDVRDIVAAYEALMTRGRPGVPYNVCSGCAHAVEDLLRALVSRSRVAVDVVVDPARYRPSDTPLLLGDPGRIARETGWRPAIDLDRTLDDLLGDWRARVRA